MEQNKKKHKKREHIENLDPKSWSTAHGHLQVTKAVNKKFRIQEFRTFPGIVKNKKFSLHATSTD